MTYNLVFLDFNNYYNRRIKRYETVDEYITRYNYHQETDIRNVNYNDGINISIVVNKDSMLTELGYNYVLALNEDNSIESRWFIVEEKQTRQGQWILSLRRDLVADFMDKFLSADIYVEKGRVKIDTIQIETANPLLFNQEQFSANQIKKSEIELRDLVGCKWIVGYLNKGNYPDDTQITTHTNLGSTTDTSVATATDLSFLDKYKTAYMKYPVSLTASFNYTQKNIGGLYKIEVGENSFNFYNGQGNAYVSGTYLPDYEYAGKYLNGNNYNDMLNATVTRYPNLVTDRSEWFRVLGLADKTILVRDTGKIYKCKITRGPTGSLLTTVNQTNDPIWYTNLKAYARRGESAISITDSDFMFSTTVTLSEGLKVELVEIANEAYKVTIPASRNRTLNEAFDAFAIPYVSNEDEQIYVHIENNILCKVTDATGALAIAQELVDVNTEALDLQLLPYCPLPMSMFSRYQAEGDTRLYPILTVTESLSNIEASSILTIDDVANNAIFWLTNTQFSTVLEYNDTNNYSTPDDIKAINQLDTWRLSSGDYSSSFEFNMARNGGVQYFEIDCKYKPYQPYIHIAPNFGGLYGRDYNDTRGLVCSNTNYSLPRLTDAWESYERNNINYMNAFNRQIQNMDTIREKQRTGEIWGAAAGSLTGAVSGAALGTMIAPGLGTIAGLIGGAGGGIASAAGGITDIIMNEQLYKENKQYAIDQFNMSLQNIQALPNSLVAVGALNPNNKVFPVLEYYSCSDIERQAFLNKLRWNGYTIGVITNNIADYIDPSTNTYIKGQIINIDIPNAAHEASEIANEVAKGIIMEGDN